MNLIEQLKRDEGVRLKPYTDTEGKLTVGVGFNLTDEGLYQEEIDFILANRVSKVENELSQFSWYMALDGVRRAVVANMTYNMGLTKLLHFVHMLAALAKQDWVTAASEMANSQWAQQVGDRATRLEQQIVGGEWI